MGFILCLVLGCFLISFSFSWLKESSQCPPEWLLPIYIPSIGGGGIPCVHTLSALIVCMIFGNGHSEQCDVILHCSLELHFTNVYWTELNWMCSDVDILWFFFKDGELNLHLELSSLTLALFWILFWWQPQGHFRRAGVFYLQPLDPCKCLIPTAQLCMLLQKMATRRQHYFMPHFCFPCKCLVIFYWLRGDFWFCVCYSCTGTRFSYT